MSHVRHVRPVPPERAKGRVAEVYAQVDAELSSIGPAVRMLSPSPELTAAAWALMREAQLVPGRAPAASKASVALGVSQANGVRYDTDAYTAMAAMLGGVDETARAWGSALESPVPGPAEGRAEYLGTALFTHYVNRMVAVMLPPGLSPGGMREDEERPFEDAPVWRTPAALAPGRSLPLLDGNPPGTVPVWAGDTPIGRAYACLAATAAQGRGFFAERTSDLIGEVVNVHGGHLTPDVDADEAVAGLGGGNERLGAKVAILAALAPSRLADEDVAAWRAADRRYSDHCTVYLLSYGAMAAVEAIAAEAGFSGA